LTCPCGWAKFRSVFKDWCAEASMQILVCLKQVPDKDSRYKIDASGRGVHEEDLVFETNESDHYALEEALRLKEKFGGEVVLLSLGDDRVLKAIKNGLAMGADRALHITGTDFHGSDAHVVATAIQRAIEGQVFDVVLTGVQSDDLAFGQTGTILAALLGWSHATIVMEIALNPEAKTVQVKRELESNLFEKVEIPLPAVLAIQSGINQPRYATLKGIMQAKKKDIKTLSSQDLRMKSDDVGPAGSRVDHQKLSFPEKKKKTVLIEGEPEEAAKQLMEKLRKEARVL
jgi:electron transfer flavoprotein beta subunit